MHLTLKAIDTEPRPFRWTREQYYRAADLGLFRDRRVQLIDGEILEMSPQGNTHALLIPIIHEVLRSAFGDGFTIRPQLPMVMGGASDPEPDLAVVRGNPREQERHPASAVLVVEVADTSLVFDSTRKAALYARAGIGEYWIVNLVNVCLDVFRKPAIDRRFEFGAGYEDVRSLGAEENISALAAPNAVIPVGDLLP